MERCVFVQFNACLMLFGTELYRTICVDTLLCCVVKRWQLATALHV